MKEKTRLMELFAKAAKEADAFREAIKSHTKPAVCKCKFYRGADKDNL